MTSLKKYESGGESEQGSKFLADISNNGLFHVEISLKMLLEYCSS